MAMQGGAASYAWPYYAQPLWEVSASGLMPACPSFQVASCHEHCGTQSAPAPQGDMQFPANLSSEAHVTASEAQMTGAARFRGKVWQSATDGDACWDLQDFIQEAPEDDDIVLLAREFHGRVVEAMRCPNANHVLQKFIQRVPANSLEFVVDELRTHGFVAAAKHKFGCRVVQRLLENLSGVQLLELQTSLLKESMDLSKHASAHFVMVCLLASAQSDCCDHSIALTNALTDLVSSLGQDDKVHGSHAQ